MGILIALALIVLAVVWTARWADNRKDDTRLLAAWDVPPEERS